mmetsp:Transcript_26392/g.66140  ORF Transcript_26392/g.66140 Transcript_26392/m.66140 type:complete len:278 (-) Transcript_26392:2152-2985(-)
MHNLTPMKVLKAEQQLLGVVSAQILVKDPEPPEHAGDAAAGHVLEEDVHLVVPCALRTQVADDVPVAELLTHGDLALHGGDLARAWPCAAGVPVVRGELELLHRHELPGLLVEPGVHLAERPLAQELSLRPKHLACFHGNTAARLGTVVRGFEVRDVRGGWSSGMEGIAGAEPSIRGGRTSGKEGVTGAEPHIIGRGSGDDVAPAYIPYGRTAAAPGGGAGGLHRRVRRVFGLRRPMRRPIGIRRPIRWPEQTPPRGARGVIRRRRANHQHSEPLPA